jgi:hypothetical protein
MAKRAGNSSGKRENKEESRPKGYCGEAIPPTPLDTENV